MLLEEERARKALLLPALRADISSANAARQDSNVDDEHDPEGSTIAFELSQAAALMQQSSATLVQVEAALGRIADGSYGYCEICGAPIAEGRLEARPWTPYCIDHAGGTWAGKHDRRCRFAVAADSVRIFSSPRPRRSRPWN